MLHRDKYFERLKAYPEIIPEIKEILAWRKNQFERYQEKFESRVKHALNPKIVDFNLDKSQTWGPINIEDLGGQVPDVLKRLEAVLEYDKKYLDLRNAQGPILSTTDPVYLNLFDKMYYMKATHHLDEVNEIHLNPLIQDRRTKKLARMVARDLRLENLKKRSREKTLNGPADADRDESKDGRSMGHEKLNRSLERIIKQSRSALREKKRNVLITPVKPSGYRYPVSDSKVNIINGSRACRPGLNRQLMLHTGVKSDNHRDAASVDRPSSVYLTNQFKKKKRSGDRNQGRPLTGMSKYLSVSLSADPVPSSKHQAAQVSIREENSSDDRPTTASKGDLVFGRKTTKAKIATCCGWNPKAVKTKLSRDSCDDYLRKTLDLKFQMSVRRVSVQTIDRPSSK